MCVTAKLFFLGLLLYLISFCSLSENYKVYSKSYNECLKNSKSFPQTFDCVDIELGKQIERRKDFISKYKNITSSQDGTIVDVESFIKSQSKYIDDKCMLLHHVGGQNGVLLQKQCLLDESILLQEFLYIFVKAIDA